jgi:hypothetical protein
MTYEVLVSEIQCALGVLLDAEVQCLDSRSPWASCILITLNLQPRSAKTLLRLEDGVVVYGDLDRLELRAIEPGVGDIGKQQCL